MERVRKRSRDSFESAARRPKFLFLSFC